MNNICRKYNLRKVIGITWLGILLLASAGGAATITVDDSGGADYTKIQDAVNAASVGDTIRVNSGTYYENVFVNKRLTLIGSDTGEGKPVVNAGGSGDAITLSAESITLGGFIVLSTGTYNAGILVNSNDNIIRNNTAQNNMRGVYLNFSDNNTVRDNIIITASNWYAGINLKNSNKNTLDNNTISNYDNYFGILLESSDNNNLIGNIVTNCRSGIDLMLSNYNLVRNNMVTGSGLVSFGISGNNNIIYNNFFNSTSNWGIGTFASLTTWNIPKTAGTNIIGGSYLGGNVWANPSNTDFSQTCTDGDSDGICDTPYTIYGSNIDYLPLAYKPAIPDTTAPTLTFTAQTPANNSNIGQKWVFIEINSNELLKNALLEWNGVNESMCCFGTDRHKRKVSVANGTHKFRVWGSDYFGNWNSTELRVITVSAPPSDRVLGGGSGNGSVAIGPMTWTASNFPAFWHEDGISGEMLAVLQPDLSSSQRIISKMNLVYNTTGKIIPYKVYTETGLTVEKGLECQYGSGGGCYAKVGWFGKPYVAVNGKANRLSKIVLEQSITDTKILSVNETWHLGEGYSLKLESLDTKALPLQAWIIFNKSGTTLDDQVVDDDTRSVYTFVSKSLAGETDVPIFVTYVDNISSNSIRLKYTWLISDNVTEVHAGDIFGKLMVSAGGTSHIDLNNDADITLARNTVINLFDALNFVVNDSASLAYYPMMTEGGPTIPSYLSIVINKGSAYTNSTSATLDLSAVNAEHISFSNDSISWSAWENFTTTKSWTLTSGDGLKAVYFKARNGAGEAAPINDTIILDTTPPTVVIDSPPDDTLVNTTNITVIGTATDSSGMKGGCFEQSSEHGGGGGCGRDLNNLTSIAFTYNLTLQEGKNFIKITYIDVANNSGSASINVTLHTVPPSVTNLSLSILAPKINDPVNITADIHDKYPDSSKIFVEVKHPSGFTNKSSMLGNGTYYLNYTNTSEYGRYNVTIIASDLAGNINDTEKTWFVTSKSSSTIRLLNGGKGETADGSWMWNSTNFPYFIHNETLSTKVLGRTIDKNGLWYNISRKFDANDSRNISSRSTNMTTGETWDLGYGYTIMVPSIDAGSSPRRVWLVLSKNGIKQDEDVIEEGETYVYAAENFAGEIDIPLFFTAERIFYGPISAVVQLKFSLLIPGRVVNIRPGDNFDNLTVWNTAWDGWTQYMHLTNQNASITLFQDSSLKIMGDLYFKVENNTNLSYYPYFKEVNTVDLLSNNLSIDILVNGSITADISITEMASFTPGMSSDLLGFKFMKKLIDINVTNETRDHLEWVKIKFYYTQSELDAAGLKETDLKILWHNETSIKWENVPQQEVNTTNTGIYSGHVWVKMDHLSTFALVGSVPTPTQQYYGPSGGGGGGGGGGGPSGENYSNIDLKENYDEVIYKDKPTSYRFKNASNPVMFVNITGNVNAGLINTAVEVLRGTSSLVTEVAPGIVYKNINLWVGTSGFSTSKNIKEATVMFRVQNSWMDSNALASSDIKLVKWGSGKWVTLETSEKMRDSTYTYFEAITETFSPFAITGLKEVLPTITHAVTITPLETTPSITGVTPEVKPPINWNLIIGVLIVIGIVIIVYLKGKGIFKKLE